MKINEISKNLYKITLGDSIPIYLQVDKNFIRIVQPFLKEGEKFEENEYFKRGFPQEIIIDKNNIKEMFNWLGKLLITENLK